PQQPSCETPARSLQITHARRPKPPPPSTLLLNTHHPAPSPGHPLSLHDALPISFADLNPQPAGPDSELTEAPLASLREQLARSLDRKSTRLNSSHVAISYAVFCLKKKRS